MKPNGVRERWLAPGLLIGLVVLVCLPRFNRADLLVAGVTGDASDALEYVRFVKYFRGEAAELPISPFSYRPFVPFVAALLPLAAMTAINVVNVVALVVGLLFLLRLLSVCGIEYRFRIIGGGLYALSFPTFYYGAVGIIDPVLIAFLVAGMYCIAAAAYPGLAATLVLGATVKETIVLLMPVLLVHLWFRYRCAPNRSRLVRSFLLLTGLSLACLSSAYLCRRFSVDQHVHMWRPSLEHLAFNASRPRTWIAGALSFGVPGALVVGLLPSYLRHRPGETLATTGPLLAGTGLSVALFGYAMISAYADGRFMWSGYAFSIPLAMLLLQLRQARESHEPPGNEHAENIAGSGLTRSGDGVVQHFAEREVPSGPKTRFG